MQDLSVNSLRLIQDALLHYNQDSHSLRVLEAVVAEAIDSQSNKELLG